MHIWYVRYVRLVRSLACQSHISSFFVFPYPPVTSIRIYFQFLFRINFVRRVRCRRLTVISQSASQLDILTSWHATTARDLPDEIFKDPDHAAGLLLCAQRKLYWYLYLRCRIYTTFTIYNSIPVQDPIEYLTISKPYNHRIGVSEEHEIRRSMDFEALKLRNVRSGTKSFPSHFT